jgi:UDP-N-acetylglucosamine--N-acetylmuramyl-(pentapeptide) pyrophosphoryl-undecaprenol N-acetylglucosamine transferase
MKIVLTGGGSGGHITPVLAVAEQLKRQDPHSEILYIGQHGDDLLDVVKNNHAIDRVETVSAGKLRRYSSEGWRQMLDIKTQALNIRDVFRTVRGVLQSYSLIRQFKPAVLFTRGSSVSVPVALAARACRVPYITHDADSVPSLANRLIGKWASWHAVALPPEFYSYPAATTIFTGMPVASQHRPVTKQAMQKFRQELGLQEYDQVIVITGGGNGARSLNAIMVANTRYVLSRFPNLIVLHFAGRSLRAEIERAYDNLRLDGARSRVKVYDFVTDFYRYSGAADVIIARGGMGSLAEFAAQRKACIVVPSPQLVWNVKNSDALASRAAIVQLNEAQAEQPERLGRAVGDLLTHPAKIEQLGARLSEIARPEAATDLARLIIETGQKKLV